jgi:hypothetical protein
LSRFVMPARTLRAHSARHRRQLPSPADVEPLRHACADPPGPLGPTRTAPGRTSRLLGIPGLSMLYPSSCPQPWTEVDTGGALIRRGSWAYAVGDRSRLVEKLSPGMCTGWGDLVAAGSPEVTDRRAGPVSQPPHGIRHRTLDKVLTCVYEHHLATPGVGTARHPRDTARRLGTTLGIQQGDTGDSRWTTTGRGAQPSRCPRVDTGDALTTHSRPTGPFGR